MNFEDLLDVLESDAQLSVIVTNEWVTDSTKVQLKS